MCEFNYAGLKSARGTGLYLMAAKRTSTVDWMGTILPGALALMAVLVLQLADVTALTRVGQLVFDSYVRAEPRKYQPVPVKVVDIDEASIRKFGQWPWPRTEIARLIKTLGDAGASVVALDIVFSEPDRTSPQQIADRLKRMNGDPNIEAALRRLPDNDTLLAQTLREVPVVTGFFLSNDPKQADVTPKAGFAISGDSPLDIVPDYRNAILPLPALEQAATGNGSLTLSGDSDAIIRAVPLVVRQGEQLLPSLSLEALRVAQGAGSITIKTSTGSGNIGAGSISEITSIKVGEFEVPTTRTGGLWMHYAAPQTDRVVPAWKILSGALSEEELAAQFGGHIVFVGAGAIGLRDLVSTPIRDRELGVMVHAEAAEQMILGQFLTRPDWASGLERALVVLFGVSLLWFLPKLGAIKGALQGLVLAGGALAGSWYAFHDFHFLIDPTYPMLAIVVVYITETGLTYYREEQRRSYIHRAFDRYLSPELVRRIAADPRQLELGGEERQMSVLFCDIRGFTRISEKFAPKDIVRFLISFLTPMSDILLARKATIDKYIGDAIVAFWNAPLDDLQQYENAARSALAMIEQLEQLNSEMPGKLGEPWPGHVEIGIGLNAGPCCVGNMGSAQRLSYSLIGDTVNLASRIEGLTKYYAIQIAIGSAMRAEIPEFAAVVVDLVRVVGRDRPEEISALLGDQTTAQNPEFRQFAVAHGSMIVAFRKKDWETALQRLDETTETARNFGLGKVHELYRERIAALQAVPPADDWDGVFDSTEK
jgi:adenylate cyclase